MAHRFILVDCFNTRGTGVREIGVLSEPSDGRNGE
jgi:hypothetical protein